MQLALFHLALFKVFSLTSDICRGYVITSAISTFSLGFFLSLTCHSLEFFVGKISTDVCECKFTPAGLGCCC